MQVKKYAAASMPEAIAKVKAELGPDAIIFSSRQVRPKGIFGPSHVEVTAALESLRSSLGGSYGANSPLPADNPLAAHLNTDSASTRSSDIMDTTLASLRKEVRGLRDDLLTEEFETSRDALVGHLESVREIMAAYSMHNFGGANDWFANILSSADIEDDIAADIAADARARFSKQSDGHDAISENGISLQQECLIETIGIRLDEERYRGPAQQTAMALVGPTGVGKTTTIAKIAANAALVRKRRVGLITTDTFRVGAVEQLRHYADLIGVPLETVSSAEEFAYAMSRFDKYDLVLIDTAGRNPADVSQVPGLVEMFEDYNIEVHLAIEAATRRYEVRDIISRYAALRPAALIITKYDEARVFGAVINAVELSKAPISYITEGQRVPEDITRPRPQVVARRIVESVMAVARPRLERAVENSRHIEMA